MDILQQMTKQELIEWIKSEPFCRRPRKGHLLFLRWSRKQQAYMDKEGAFLKWHAVNSVTDPVVWEKYRKTAAALEKELKQVDKLHRQLAAEWKREEEQRACARAAGKEAL